ITQAVALAPQAASPAMPSPAVAAVAAVPPAPEPPEEPLRLIERVEPEYPAVLLRGRGSGSVLVQFEVKPDGTVQAPEVLKSSNQRLVASVLAAVARWRFAPISKTRVATVEVGFRPPE
ncbi:energy transducer TonB, partial [Paucibacter sp. XJ19-41]|uniref:energy transducer TonB n=1 Tax=Paucibacter sp. XJ19-41 TaxID=2927824 RepID=UPI0023498D5E